MAVGKPRKSAQGLVKVINGDAVIKGPLCQKIVVLFFRTVDDIRPRPSDSTSPRQVGAAPLSLKPLR